MLPRIVEMATGELSFVAKLALVPEAPVPVFPYSPKVTCPVRSSPVFQMRHPALLMTALNDDFWNTTRAYSPHGLPR